MSGALLDTSVLIADPAEVASVLPPSAAISVVTLGELHAGVQIAAGRPAAAIRLARLTRVRAAFRPIPVDEAIAERYGEVLALARRERRIVKATDLLIIATALMTERELVTLDHAQGRLAEATGLRVVR